MISLKQLQAALVGSLIRGGLQLLQHPRSGREYKPPLGQLHSQLSEGGLLCVQNDACAAAVAARKSGLRAHTCM